MLNIGGSPIDWPSLWDTRVQVKSFLTVCSGKAESKDPVSQFLHTPDTDEHTCMVPANPWHWWAYLHGTCKPLTLVSIPAGYLQTLTLVSIPAGYLQTLILVSIPAGCLQTLTLVSIPAGYLQSPDTEENAEELREKAPRYQVYGHSALLASYSESMNLSTVHSPA